MTATPNPLPIVNDAIISDGYGTHGDLKAVVGYFKQTRPRPTVPWLFPGVGVSEIATEEKTFSLIVGPNYTDIYLPLFRDKGIP